MDEIKRHDQDTGGSPPEGEPDQKPATINTPAPVQRDDIGIYGAAEGEADRPEPSSKER